MIGIAQKRSWRINLPDHLTRSTCRIRQAGKLCTVTVVTGIELMNRNQTEIGGNYQQETVTEKQEKQDK